MSQQLNPEMAKELFEQNPTVEVFKKGFRLVLFFKDVPLEGLDNITERKIMNEYAKPVPVQIKGFGKIFKNPQDNCDQAMVLFAEDRETQVDGCLIIALPSEAKSARQAHETILAEIKQFKGSPIDAAIAAGSKVTGDVYCSDKEWFDRSTEIVGREALNLHGPNFVKAKANKVEVIFVKGNIEFNSGGVSATAQKSENGMFIIKEKISQDKIEYRGCHPDTFFKLYGVSSDSGLVPVDFRLFVTEDLQQAEEGPAVAALGGALADASINDS